MQPSTTIVEQVIILEKPSYNNGYFYTVGNNINKRYVSALGGIDAQHANIGDLFTLVLYSTYFVTLYKLVK